MNSIVELSLHGTLVFLTVWFLDCALARRVRAADRTWWWVAVSIAFLISFRVPVVAVDDRVQTAHWKNVWAAIGLEGIAKQGAAASPLEDMPGGTSAWLWVWLAGALVYSTAVIVRTNAVSRRWKRERLVTDAGLLELLEDCKREASINAPIGMVISAEIFAPALLGWLRPRILLPQKLCKSMPGDQLRAVILHELAHFRSLHIPLNWLFTLARAVHWFNPFAHLAYFAWTDFREEAADEAAIGWMKAPSSALYGEALLCAIREANEHPPLFGVLAIGESLLNLKKRMTMINQYEKKTSRIILTFAVFAALVAGFIVRPTQAADPGDPRPIAVAAMQTWLQGIDNSQYSQSWKDASAFFQKSLTSDQWTAALNSVRTPLGKCTKRSLASSLHQTEVPGPTGTQKGDFVVAQFESSFENLAHAVETVSFEKSPDGSWKATGYYIKPAS